MAYEQRQPQGSQQGPRDGSGPGGQQDQGAQIVQFVAQALQSGKRPEEVIAILVEKGVDQAQATEIVQKVAEKLGGSQGGQAPSDPSEQGKQGITAEQALEVLSKLGVSGDKILEIIKVVLNVNRGELERLLGALQKSGGEQQQPQQEQEQGNY